MKISARNQLAGTVVAVRPGAVNSEITIELPGGQQIVSVITKGSAAALQLAAGKKVVSIIKASEVLIGAD